MTKRATSARKMPEFLQAKFLPAGNGDGVASDAELKMINAYALKALSAEDVYVRRMKLCHNAIDRTDERFSEKALEDIADTLPGKSVLDTHQRNEMSDIVGRFFAAEVQPDMDNELKDILPPGIEGQWLVGSFYMLRAGNEELIKRIDAGIVSWVSVGFDANGYMRVSDEETGDVLYWEIKAPAEAHEGSLVWLGAQPEARLTKSAKADDKHSGGSGHRDPGQKEKTMEKFLAQIKAAGFETLDAVLKALADAKTNLTTATAQHTAMKETLGITDEFTPEIAKTMIEAGRKFRDDLVDSLIKARRLLKMTGDTPEDETAAKALVAGYSLDQLIAEEKALTTQAMALHPEEFKPEAQKAADKKFGAAGEGRKSYRESGNKE